MDPVTHALTGLVMTTLYNGNINMLSAVRMSCVIGSVIPDADIIMQVFGDYFYLKNHRGASHSFAGVTMMSCIVSLILSMIYKTTPFWMIFLWMMIGCGTHLFLDIFNVYGAKLLWPVKKKKFSFSLIRSFDPVIFSLMLISIIKNNNNVTIYLMFMAAAYLALKSVSKIKAIKKLREYYEDKKIVKLEVLPSLNKFLKWDYVIKTENEDITGSINALTFEISIRDVLENPDLWLQKKAMNTKPGKFFGEFSSVCHIDYQIVGTNYVVTMIDLRYYMKNRYLHQATVVFDESLKILNCVFHPYKTSRNAKMPI